MNLKKFDYIEWQMNLKRFDYVFIIVWRTACFTEYSTTISVRRYSTTISVRRYQYDKQVYQLSDILYQYQLNDLSCRLAGLAVHWAQEGTRSPVLQSSRTGLSNMKYYLTWLGLFSGVARYFGARGKLSIWRPSPGTKNKNIYLSINFIS